MTPQERGDFNESLVFGALAFLKVKYPNFVVRVRRSSPGMDARGIDLLVEIALPTGTGRKTRMTVPIEVKSSDRGISKWKVVHSDLYKSGVLHVYVKRGMTARSLRRLLYRILDKVRKNSDEGMLYHSMFQRLFRGGSKNLFRNVRLIKERRAQRGSDKS